MDPLYLNDIHPDAMGSLSRTSTVSNLLEDMEEQENTVQAHPPQNLYGDQETYVNRIKSTKIGMILLPLLQSLFSLVGHQTNREGHSHPLPDLRVIADLLDDLPESTVLPSQPKHTSVDEMISLVLDKMIIRPVDQACVVTPPETFANEDFFTPSNPRDMQRQSFIFPCHLLAGHQRTEQI